VASAAPLETRRRPTRAPAPARAAPDAPADTRHHTVAGTLLLLLLAGFAMFDRTLALLSIPGVPIYPAEIVLGIGLAYLALRRPLFRTVRTGRWLAPLLLVVYLGWGLIKVLTSMGNPILDVVRDSALVYYGLFAFVVVGLADHDDRFTPRGLLEVYGRFVPWFLMVAPVRLVSATVYADQGPVLPGTDYTFLTNHRLGNLGAGIGLAVVYLATARRRDRWAVVGIVAGVLMLIVIGTQNRGGLLAGGLTLLVALVLWGRHVRLQLGWVAAVLLGTFVLAWSLNVTIVTPDSGRTISVDQLGTNITTALGVDDDPSSQAGDTIDFREELWQRVLHDTVESGQLENGWGFGKNLGSDYLPSHEDRSLRNPHNSHLTVVARLGLVGLGIWIALWVSWLVGVVGRSRVAVRTGRRWADPAGRLALLCSVGVIAILVNAYVDPTLETPMVAVWLWTLFGAGVLAVASDRSPGLRSVEPTPPARSAAAGADRQGQRRRVTRSGRTATHGSVGRDNGG
jgi:O-antigen ligase